MELYTNVNLFINAKHTLSQTQTQTQTQISFIQPHIIQA